MTRKEFINITYFLEQDIIHTAKRLLVWYCCECEITTKWLKEDIKGNPQSKNIQLLTLLFADDKVIIFNTEDNLQKVAHKLNKIIAEYGLIISLNILLNSFGLSVYTNP
jgi:hypothetical protein